MFYWIAAAALASTALLILVHLVRAVDRPADGGPEKHVGRPRSSGETRVVCFGDSHTHGRAGADWVGLLRERMGPDGYRFVNAGVNGDLAWNLGRRLEPVVACHPDVVVVLVGSNDVMAACHEGDCAGYVRKKKLPRDPAVDFYEQSLGDLIRRLSDGTGASPVLCTIPPLGEAPVPRVDAALAAHNDVVRKLGAASGLSVLPVFQRLADSIAAHPARAYVPGAREQAIGRSCVQHYLLGRSWDEVARAQGFRLLHDGIHFGETAARVVADLVEEELRSRGRDTSEGTA